MKSRIRTLTLTAALLMVTLAQLSAGSVLVGNKGLAGQTLDADGVKAALLGKKATIGSTRVVIVIIKASDAQDAYFKEHVGMTTDQFQTYWRRLFMTGGGSAPKVVETEADACKLVAETPGAIAVGDSEKVEGLTVLAAK